MRHESTIEAARTSIAAGDPQAAIKLLARMAEESDADALLVTGQAWEAARTDPEPPADALRRYVEWVKGLPGRPVFVAYPAGFDFLFVYWYLIRFAGESPFSFSAWLSFSASSVRCLTPSSAHPAYLVSSTRPIFAARLAPTPGIIANCASAKAITRRGMCTFIATAS